MADNTRPVRAFSVQLEAEVKGQMGTAVVRSKHERRMNRDDGELQRPNDSPLRHDTVGQRTAVDLSHQKYAGVKPGSSKVESEAPKGSHAMGLRLECQLSQEEGDLRRPTDSPLRHETVSRRATLDSPYHRYGGTITGETPKRAARHSASSDRSIDQSPLHPHNQAKFGGKGSGVSSPSWERKGSSQGSHGLAPSTPGRSRLGSVTRGDDTADDSTAVPKFGDWDERDPASTEGFTQLFNKVREEKQNGAGKVPSMATENSYSIGQNRYGNDNSKSCCCFPWGRK